MSTTIVVNCCASKKRKVVDEQEEESIGSQDSERSEDEESTISDRNFVVDDSCSCPERFAEQHMKVVFSTYHSEQRNSAFTSALKQLIESFDAVKEASIFEELPVWYVDYFACLQFELTKAERAVQVKKNQRRNK